MGDPVVLKGSVADLGEGPVKPKLSKLRKVKPSETREERPEPDFSGFLEALRSEKAWSAMIHRKDNTGQAASDQAQLSRLIDHVEKVGKAQGFL